jgi:hypothetical protein
MSNELREAAEALMFKMSGIYRELTDGQFGTVSEWPETIALRNALEQDKQPQLERNQSCGCVVCTCESEQCQGCGAKNCGTHPAGEILNPIYTSPPLKEMSDDEMDGVIKDVSKSFGTYLPEIKDYCRACIKAAREKA